MHKRDSTIDHLRGLAMLWVIVVHVLYWGQFFSNRYINLLKSFCLFEMPLFFFVTGASNSFSKVDRYFNFVYNRYKRVFIPYWVFALICASLSIAYIGIIEGIDIIAVIKILLSWLIPIDRQITPIPYLTWALWFVPVYLCVTLIIPFLKLMKQSKKPIVFLFVLLALFVITCILDLGWLQNVAFYSMYTYIGLFYKDLTTFLSKQRFRKYIGLVMLIGIITIVVLYAMGQPIDMQYNKFPPNIIFGVYSVVMMALILLIIPYINKAYCYLEKNKITKGILALFSKRSMTIFLYQVFAFNLTIWLSKSLIPGISNITSVIRAIFCLITTIPICAVLALVFGWVEKIGTKRCK